MSVLQAALELAADRGVPLVPCRSDKKPIQTGWTSTEWRSLEQVEAAFADSAAELVGVRTGLVSGLLVIDIDPRNGGESWYRDNFDRLACQRIHRTRSDGYHLLYTLPASLKVKSRANALARGVDIKAEGGQIIWWPAHGCAVPIDDEPGPPPQWLLDDIVALDAKPAAPRRMNGTIPEGQRNDYLTREAGRLRRAGYAGGTLATMINAINTGMCRPPLPDAEVAGILAQAARWDGSEAAPDPIRFDAIVVPTLADVQATHVPPRTWFFDSIIPAGAFLIVGRPKIGKSWLQLQFALAAARGQSFLGYASLGRTDVLYVAAEDDAARIKDRFAIIGGGDPPAGLRIMLGEQFRALAAQYGHVSLGEFFDGYLTAHPSIRALIIDTEATCRAIWDGEAGRQKDIKARDYGETREFDRLALGHRAFVGLVNHAAKRKNGALVDFHELINRTNVALAGASGSIVMADDPNRDPEDGDTKRRVLALRGRDLRDDLLLAIEQQADASFRCLGQWSAVLQTDNERSILDAAIDVNREAPGEWITSHDLAEALGTKREAVKRAVTRMAKAGRLEYQGYRIETSRKLGLRVVSMYLAGRA